MIPKSLLVVGVAVSAAPVSALAGVEWDPSTPPPPYVLPTAPTVARPGTVAAIADNSNNMNAYGPPVTWEVNNDFFSNYSIGSTVLGTTLVVGSNTTTPITGTARPQFGSSAWIRAGYAPSGSTISMQWRTATEAEFYGSSASVDMPGGGPLPDSGPWNTLGSDVLKISGMAATGAIDSQGRLPTNAYTLEMTFDPNIIVAGYQNYETFGWTISDIVNAGEMQLGYFNPSTGVWTKQINVITQGAQSVENFQGSWAAFAAATGANDLNLANFVGSWGLVIDSADPTNSRIWAVLDHTSSYAVVPAPGALGLLGVAGLVGARRRRN